MDIHMEKMNLNPYPHHVPKLTWNVQESPPYHIPVNAEMADNTKPYIYCFVV